jgi:hypothetical protein
VVKAELVPYERVENAIRTIRAQRVMLDADLAALYEVENRTLVQAVKRNITRFPEDFMFQLTEAEAVALGRQSGTSTGAGGRRYLPYAFTEQGVAMLSSVMQSPRAVQVNMEIMRAFVRLRQMLQANADLARKLARPREEVRRPVPHRLRRHPRSHGSPREAQEAHRVSEGGVVNNLGLSRAADLLGWCVEGTGVRWGAVGERRVTGQRRGVGYGE